MNVVCANHPEVEATTFVAMSSGQSPYSEEWSVCSECADRLTAIGVVTSQRPVYWEVIESSSICDERIAVVADPQGQLS